MKLLKQALWRVVHGHSDKNKHVPSTFRQHLEAFEELGAEREWQQVMMYAHVLMETRDIPGDIFEFGVASGTSFKAFVRMANILNKRNYHPISVRKVYGFDSFEGLPELDKQKDLAGHQGKEFGEMKKGGFSSQSTLGSLESFCASNANAVLVKGWYDQTVTRFIAQNPHTSCSLIHIDCDIYSSTKVVLDAFIKRLNVGGIILFDEVFHQTFPGETEAFWEVYNSVSRSIALQFRRVESMPWKWHCVRTA